MVDFRTLRFGVEVESTGATRETVARAIQIGLIGGDHKVVRAHLLRHLPGDSAFRLGRPGQVVKKEAKCGGLCAYP